MKKAGRPARVLSPKRLVKVSQTVRFIIRKDDGLPNYFLFRAKITTAYQVGKGQEFESLAFPSHFSFP
jgi:hypothetical protein